MAELVADCPRCGASQITFDVHYAHQVGIAYEWKRHWEAFSICRRCLCSTTFFLEQREPRDGEWIQHRGLLVADKALNRTVSVAGYVNISDVRASDPPEHLPDDLRNAFEEAAKCLVFGCCNAAAAMFRLCVDLATKSRLPEGDAEGLNSKIRRDLGLRLPWLFKSGRLPRELEDLSSCIREDGNDGAHAGNLGQPDAEDLQDFTYALLERLYTEPKRIELAKERREQRRAVTAGK